MLQRSLPSVELPLYLGDSLQRVRRKAQSNKIWDDSLPTCDIEEIGVGKSVT